MAENPKIVFMGTSPFAEAILKSLCDAGHMPLAVYTQPDRSAGRGMDLKASPVKKLALSLDLPVLQPENFKDPADRHALAALKPDFLIVAAYGLLLPQAVLDIPRIAPINVHGSLLPAYRGAAPIQRAIMENWQPGAKTGVSIMRMVRAMDAGPVYAEAAVPIAGHNSESLMFLLAEMGGHLLLQVLPSIASGMLQPCEQDEAKATLAPKLTKEDGVIDWRQPATSVDAHIRGVTPWPGAQTVWEVNGQSLPLIILHGEPGENTAAEPGSVILNSAGLNVACVGAMYRILRIKSKGRKAMSARDLANGLRLSPGAAGKMA